MNHESKPVHSPGVTRRIHNPWIHFFITDDLQQIIVRNLVGILIKRCKDHGFQDIEAHHPFQNFWNGVDDHIHAPVFQELHPIIIGAGGNYGLSAQLLQTAFLKISVKVVMGYHDNLGVLHGLSNDIFVPYPDGHDGSREAFAGNPFEYLVGAVGI